MNAPPPVFHCQPMLRVLPWLALALLLSGCGSWWQAQRADSQIAHGNAADGIKTYAALADKQPARYLAPYVAARDRETRRLLNDADMARRNHDAAAALKQYQEVFAIDPDNAEARHGVGLLARVERQTALLTAAKDDVSRGTPDAALQKLARILAEEPAHPEANALRQSLLIERNRRDLGEPALKESLRKPVSLEFRNAAIQAIFEVLAQSSGINFIFDKDVRSDLRTTIFARNTSVEDALRLVLSNTQLAMKVLNDSTVMIYPATPEKSKQYEELITRSFYLGSADPKKAQELIKSMAAPRAMYVDDSLRLLIVRDRMDVIEQVERLIAAFDIAPPEVVLEVQVLEVGSDALLNLGLQYPDSASASVYGSSGKVGELTLDELEDLDRDNFKAFLPDPLAVLNLKQTSGTANTLANPRIRVRNHGKAKILIGDKVPVVTTTTNQGATSESVNYLDVGLKLEVEPEVHVNNDVSIDVTLEVSNIAKEVKTAAGLLTYQIGTRNASTELRLRDGETQVLAGLIRDEERTSASHVPGLGKLPLLGRLFSNTSDTHAKTEIVLLITPHVVRSLHTPAADAIEFVSGTEGNPGGKPLRLPPTAQYSNRKLPAAPTRAVPVTAPSARAPTFAPQPAPATAQPVSDEDGEAVDPSTHEPVAPDNTTAYDETSPGLDPAIAELRFDFVAPAQIRSGQQFTLAIMSAGRAFDAVDMDVLFAPAGFELVRSTPVGLATLDVQPTSEGLKIVAKEGGGAGALAMLTLRATAVGGTAVSIRMPKVTAKRPGDMSLLVAPAPPREIRITP